jgi:hypothetical integral membrane protein (TIGR02206 family)
MHQHVIVGLFSPLWWTGLISSILGIAIIVLIGKYSSTEIKNKMAVAIGILLIGFAVFIHIYEINRGEWTKQSCLPLNLCSLSAILSGIVLLRRNQLAYEILLFWGISGATHSILTPEMTLGNDGWYGYDYYLSHAGIILSAIYLTVVLGMRPRAYSWLKIFLYTQLVLITVFMIDKFIGANYMYLVAKPVVENPFVIGDWPWYILGFELAGILHFGLVYVIFQKNKNPVWKRLFFRVDD